MGGDFNEILYESEKVGGAVRSLNKMSGFRDVISSCMLCDLNCKGDPFTWCNRRQNDEIIFEHLDRFLCDFEWKCLFPDAEVNHLDFYSSDHRLI